MAITTPRYSQATYFSSGQGNVTIPAGSVAGELAILNIDGTGSTVRKPVDMTGWLSKAHTYSTDSYWKLLTAAEITLGYIAIKGYIGFLTVYPGAGRVGNVTDLGNTTPGCNLTTAGAWLHVHARGDSALTPATGKLGTDVTLTAYSSRKYNVWSQAETTTGYKTLAGTFNGSDSNGFEIIPLEGPNAPTILTPTTGITVAYNEALTATFRHNSNRGVAMNSFRAKVVDGATTYYVTAAGALTTTLTTLSSSVELVTIASTAMATGKTYKLSIATSEDGVVFSSYSAVTTFYTGTRPTVNSITVTSPADDLTPTVAFTCTTTGGLVASRVRICLAADATPANPIWDSGVVSGTGLSMSAPALSTWPNGTNLKAWVDVQQPGLWSVSTADDTTFTVSWTAPAAPSSVTAANQTSGPLQITVNGVGSRTYVQIQVSTDAGASWSDLITIAPSGSSIVVDHPLAQYGQNARYRARASTTNVDGILLWSSWTAMTTDVASTDTKAYVVSQDLLSYVQVRLQRDSSGRNRPQGFSTFYPFGATVPTVYRTPAAGFSGIELVGVSTYAALDTLTAILDEDHAWWWRFSPEISPTGTLVAQPAVLATLNGELSYQRLADSILTDRLVPLQWVEQ